MQQKVRLKRLPQKEKNLHRRLKKRKKAWSEKFLIIVIVLGVLGGGGFAAYTFFFSGAGDESGRAPYKPQTLSHVQLPEEMRRFCYERLPELYDAILEYNAQMTLLNEKIAQIEAVAQKYPGEAKIADKEKKVWEKTRDTLEKSFNKLEKPVKESYVLFRVNQEAGLATVEEKKQDLTKTAADALALAKEMTEKLIAMPRRLRKV